MPGYRWADIGKERLPIPIEKVDNVKQVIESSPMEYESCCGSLSQNEKYNAGQECCPIEVPGHFDFLRFSLEGNGVFSLILEGATYCNGTDLWARMGGLEVIFDEPTKMTQPIYISKIPKFRLKVKCFEAGSLTTKYHLSNVCQVAEKQLGVKKDSIKFMDLTIQWKT